MSTACLDPRPARVVVPAAARIRPRPVEAAATRGRAEPAGWTRMAIRAQWGPVPADAVRLDGRDATATATWTGEAASGSLAAWAARSRGAACASSAWRIDAAARMSSVRHAVAAGCVRLMAVAGAPWRAWRRERRIAAGIAALSELDARLLRDIGVERADIVRVARDGGPLRR